MRLRSKVRGFPLEKVRLATPDELLGSQFIIQALDEVQTQIKRGQLVLEEQVPVPDAEGQASIADHPPRRQREDTLVEVDEEEEQLDDEQILARQKQLRRMELVNDVPESVRQAISSGLSSGSSSVALKRPMLPEERAELLAEDDEWMSEEVPTSGTKRSSGPEPSTWEFQKKKKMFEELGKKKKGPPSKLSEAQLRSGMSMASAQVKNIRKMIRKSRYSGLNPAVRRKKADQQAAASMVMVVEAVEETQHEVAWSTWCAEMECQEAFWSQEDQQQRSLNEIQEKVEELTLGHQQAAEEAQIVTGKARLEMHWNQLDDQWKAAFEEPLIKAVKIYFDHDALEGVPEDKFIDPKRILTSRFVLTNKGEPTLEKAKLKGRLVLGGHKDPDAGRYPTMAPTAALLAHNLINWVSVQFGWVVKYEDVSSAFLQGRPLPPEREVYVKIPKGYPDYVEKFILKQVGKGFRQDLLKMTKGGFGLPESPRLWYLEYKETLCGCGMKELRLMPGVFVAFHPDGRLRALACIHVDDTRYCGDDSSEEIWKKVHEKLNFGDLRKATDGWVKFCGRWEKQDEQTKEFYYSMDEYAKNIQKIPNKMKNGEKKDLDQQQKVGMSSTLGQLNWMSRQGRYDLTYGISHVQQMAAHDGQEALEMLNKVVYRAKQPMTQVIKKLDDWRNMVIVSASDAAYGAQPGGYSQGGLVIGLADEQILDGEAKICIIEAASMKIQRVVRCSMSAEVSMAATAFEHGDFVRAALSEMLFSDFQLKDWKQWANRWRHFLVIDAKTGFDVLNNESQTSDRKIQIDLAVLKQALTEETANAFTRWVPGHHIISDTMTKWYGNGALALALTRGMWSLKDTEEACELRREASKKRQQYKKASRMDNRGGVSN